MCTSMGICRVQASFKDKVKEILINQTTLQHQQQHLQNIGNIAIAQTAAATKEFVLAEPGPTADTGPPFIVTSIPESVGASK